MANEVYMNSQVRLYVELSGCAMTDATGTDLTVRTTKMLMPNLVSPQCTLVHFS